MVFNNQSMLAWVLLFFSCVRFSLAHIIPPEHHASLRPRAKIPGAAGMGIELEVRRVQMVNSAIIEERSTGRTMEKLKGAAMDGETYAKNGVWMLSAEQSDEPSIRMVVPEFIIDGTKVGLGTSEAVPAVEAVLKFMDNWKPSVKAQRNQMTIDGFGDKNFWKIITPDEYRDTMNYGIQITTSMPLAGIEDLFRDAASSSILKNVLLGDNPKRPKNMHWVKVDHFSDCDTDDKYPKEFPQSMASADVRAFFSLVLTYAKGASNYNPKEQSPKMISLIMPRTDFATMYEMIKPKIIKPVKAAGSLYAILDKLAKFDGSGGDDIRPGNKLDRDLDIYGYENKDSTTLKNFPVNIKKWIDGLEAGKDYLAEGDKAADGQIGALGSKTEGTANNPARKAPIFEFRDSAAIGSTALKAKIQRLEQAAVALHGSFSLKREADLYQRADDKNSKSCPRCKKGQAAVGKDGACENCPAGKEPSADQKTCVDEKKCGAGEAKTGPSGECQKCPAGKEPSADQKTCTDEKKCGAGEAKTGPSGECQKCPAGKEPSTDQNTCVDEKKCGPGEAKTGPAKECQKCPAGKVPAGDGKSCENDKKNDKDRDKKKARNKWCLGFLASSGLIEGAESLRTDIGTAALEEAAEVWPENAIFGNLDYLLGDGNMDLDEDRRTMVPSEWLTQKRSLAKRESEPSSVQGQGIHRRFIQFVGFLAAVAARLGQAIVVAVRNAAQAIVRASAAVGRTAMRVGGRGRVGRQNDNKLNDLNKMSPKDQSARAAGDLAKLKDSKKYLDCLAMAAGGVSTLVAGGAIMHTSGVPDGGFKAVDDALALVLFDRKDGARETDIYNPDDHGEDGPIRWDHWWTTYPDTLWHDNRINLGTCQGAGDMAGVVSAYSVSGGCCAFYATDTCTGALFSATDRSDMDLQGNHNNKIRSFSCVKDANCAGVPNMNEPAKGQCGVHITQKLGEWANTPTSFEVSVKDAGGTEIYKYPMTKAPSGVISFKIPKLDIDMKIDISGATLKAEGKSNDQDNAKITIGKDSFWSGSSGAKEPRCSFGGYDNGKRQQGKREGDCGFAC